MTNRTCSTAGGHAITCDAENFANCVKGLPFKARMVLIGVVHLAAARSIVTARWPDLRVRRRCSPARMPTSCCTTGTASPRLSPAARSASPRAYMRWRMGQPGRRRAFLESVSGQPACRRRSPGGARPAAAVQRFRHWLNSNTAPARDATSPPITISATPSTRHGSTPSMTYSSALFADRRPGSDSAQKRQVPRARARRPTSARATTCWRSAAAGADLPSSPRARSAAKVTGLTISREQHDFATARMQRPGCPTRSRSACRTIATRRGTYDRIASIEMFEAVGEKYWPAFFAKVRDRLKPGGRRRHADHHHQGSRFSRSTAASPDFIQRYVFPGGMLPTPASCVASASSAVCR